MAKKTNPPPAADQASPRKPTITVSEELHERCKAWAALHGKELTVFVEEWIEKVTADLKPIHKKIRAERDYD